MSKPGKELYIGSLSYNVTEYDIEKLFSVSGTVTSIHLITDHVTGEFKGCGYVRMSTEAEAKDAVESLDNAMLIDRQITVSIAKPQKMRPQGGGARGKFIPKKKDDLARASEGNKPAAARPASPRPAPGKPAAERPRFSKSDEPKAGFSRPDAPKARFSRSDDAKTGGFSKPASSRPGFSKPGASKTGPGRTGKR